jgi:hypothetical protein
MIYLDAVTIVRTKLSYHIDRLEDGCYDAGVIRALAVDGLQDLQYAESNEAGGLVNQSLEESLRKVVEVATASLETTIVACFEMAAHVPANKLEKRVALLVYIENMRASVLHREQCTIWEGNKEIESGRPWLETIADKNEREKAVTLSQPH